MCAYTRKLVQFLPLIKETSACPSVRHKDPWPGRVQRASDIFTTPLLPGGGGGGVREHQWRELLGLLGESIFWKQ